MHSNQQKLPLGEKSLRIFHIPTRSYKMIKIDLNFDLTNQSGIISLKVPLLLTKVIKIDVL